MHHFSFANSVPVISISKVRHILGGQLWKMPIRSWKSSNLLSCELYIDRPEAEHIPKLESSEKGWSQKNSGSMGATQIVTNNQMSQIFNCELLLNHKNLDPFLKL